MQCCCCHLATCLSLAADTRAPAPLIWSCRYSAIALICRNRSPLFEFIGHYSVAVAHSASFRAISATVLLQSLQLVVQACPDCPQASLQLKVEEIPLKRRQSRLSCAFRISNCCLHLTDCGSRAPSVGGAG